MVPYSLKIEQNEKTLNLTKVQILEYKEDLITQEILHLDGTESHSTGFMDSPKTSTAILNNNLLEVKSILKMSFGGGMEVKSDETWSLSPSGSMLTIETTSISPMGTMVTSIVYTKK